MHPTRASHLIQDFEEAGGASHATIIFDGFCNFCVGAVKFNGEGNREALAIGTLMNSRGLMELIILNIGLERGIITPTLFTVMVVMAIVTTLMASPLFSLVYERGHETGPDFGRKQPMSAMQVPSDPGA